MQKNSYIDFVSWTDIETTVKKICPNLAELINQIDPPKAYQFIKVNYPFGAEIISAGQLNLPTQQGKIVPLFDRGIPESIGELLGYSSVPLGIVAKNTIEVYRGMEDRIFSIASWAKGLDIGIWEYFGWTTPYSICAGGRSLYMVPRITLKSAHMRLKRDYGVSSPPPKRLYDHWSIFKEIANHPDFNSDWTCEIFYFTKPWIDKLLKAKSERGTPWGQLHAYLGEKFSDHSGYGRRISIHDIVWELFVRSLNDKGFKCNPYIIATLKHLVFVASGGVPASAPNTGETDLGPIPDLQQVYLDCYGLKEYVPTIMQPTYFSTHDSKPVYYSLQSPTLLESVHSARGLVSIADNVRELRDLADHFLEKVFDDYLKMENVAVNDIIRQIQLTFYHEQSYAYGKIIRPTHEMPLKDPRLLSIPKGNAERAFADSSPYLHGCVTIHTKE